MHQSWLSFGGFFALKYLQHYVCIDVGGTLPRRLLVPTSPNPVSIAMSHSGHSGPGNLLSLEGRTASIASLQLLPLPCFRGRSREPRTLEVSWQESDARWSKHWESCVTVFCERSHQWPFQDHSFVRVYGGAPSLGWRWERVAPSLSQWEGRAMPQSSAPTRLPRKPHSQSFAKPGKGSRASLESPLNKSYRDGLAPL